MEIGFAMLVMAGAMWVWRTMTPPAVGMPVPPDIHARIVATLTPQCQLSVRPIDSSTWARSAGTLYLLDHGILLEQASDNAFIIAFADIRARLMADRFSKTHEFYCEDGMTWLHVRLAFTDLDDALAFDKLLNRRNSLTPIIGIERHLWQARLAEQSWEGDLRVGGEVTLVLLEQTLLVLVNGIAQHRLLLSGVKRVMATERAASSGLVRLFSGSETALFEMDDYREFADTIARRALVPFDVVTTDQRKSK